VVLRNPLATNVVASDWWGGGRAVRRSSSDGTSMSTGRCEIFAQTVSFHPRRRRHGSSSRGVDSSFH